MNRYPLVLLFCFFSLSAVASDDDEENELKPTQIINGQVVIHLDEESQEASGLETQQFKTIEFQKEITAYGKAVNVSPLLSIISQYQSAAAKKAGAKARLAKAESTIARLRNLHKNEAVSTRKLQDQQSQWQSDKAIYDEMVYKSKLIINQSQLLWGEHITHWVTGQKPAQFDHLISGKSTLLTVTLAAGNTLLDNVETILISPTGEREGAFKASFISRLPSIDQFSQGLQYSFLSDNPNIKPGMNFTAWIPQFKNKLVGIIIPESAIAWHLGQSFVFIKIDEEQFIHQNIINPIKVPKGYFITEQLTDNQEIVVTGTQMLLSHEFRSQIPDEDDDD